MLKNIFFGTFLSKYLVEWKKSSNFVRFFVSACIGLCVMRKAGD